MSQVPGWAPPPQFPPPPPPRRRRGRVLIGVFVVAALVVVGLGVVGTLSRRAEKKTSDDAATVAGCSAVRNTAAPAENKHVADGQRVAYDQTPPTSGDHWPQPAPGNRVFYERGDGVAVERLVHNLEHGYVVIWYDGRTSDADVVALRDVALGAGRKVIVAPWDDGDLPEGPIALAAWQNVQHCQSVSDRVIADFVDDYRAPAGQAPEKSAF